jgi:hypothetical protein
VRISDKESIGLCKSKSYKSFFNEECLKLVDRRKQAKLQWLQNPGVANEDNLRNERREGTKKKEYLKDKITETELNSKNRNIRCLYTGTTEFKKGYQRKTDLVKDERGNILPVTQKNFTSWKNY